MIMRLRMYRSFSCLGFDFGVSSSSSAGAAGASTADSCMFAYIVVKPTVDGLIFLSSARDLTVVTVAVTDGFLVAVEWGPEVESLCEVALGDKGFD